ncbi:MAG TPA: hypothetical protein PL124_13080, partial [Candidatus Cloacimonadota bacterium]|nr:hypothetical protein [Candidatus Cloacimonadota bacterium]
LITNKNMMSAVENLAQTTESVAMLQKSIQQIQSGDISAAENSLTQAKILNLKDKVTNPKIRQAYALATDAINLSHVQEVVATEAQNDKLISEIKEMRQEAGDLVTSGAVANFDTEDNRRLYVLEETLASKEKELKKNINAINADAESRNISEAIYRSKKAKTEAEKQFYQDQAQEANDRIWMRDAGEYNPETDTGTEIQASRGASGITGTVRKAGTKANAINLDTTEQIDSADPILSEEENQDNQENGNRVSDTPGQQQASAITAEPEQGTSGDLGQKTELPGQENTPEKGKQKYLVIINKNGKKDYVLADEITDKRIYFNNHTQYKQNKSLHYEIPADQWARDKAKAEKRSSAASHAWRTRHRDSFFIPAKDIQKMENLRRVWGKTIPLGEYEELRQVVVDWGKLKHEPLIKWSGKDLKDVDIDQLVSDAEPGQKGYVPYDSTESRVGKEYEVIEAAIEELRAYRETGIPLSIYEIVRS